jgi:hypothetical protein
MRILEVVPLLNVGLAAQQLIDRERDRHNEELDRLELVAQQEEHFRALQAAQLNEADLARIVRQQMHSLEEQVRHQLLAASPVSEKSDLSKEFLVNLSDVVFHNKIDESDIGALYHGTWRDQPVTISGWTIWTTKTIDTTLCEKPRCSVDNIMNTSPRFMGHV